MRNIFLLLSISIIFLRCSKEEDEPLSLFEEQALEYGIDISLINIDGVMEDSLYIFFNGRIDNKNWMAGFEKNSGENIIDYTPPLVLG